MYEFEPRSPAEVRSTCPDCEADLKVLRVIPGRACEYWTLRCIGCGGIHLDIVEAPPPPAAIEQPACVIIKGVFTH